MGSIPFPTRRPRLGSATPRPWESAAVAAPARLAPIGELSDLLKLSRRAIRHYEQLGLVGAVRGPNSVRLFDQAARRRLEWIAKLRLTGIGLREIAEILSLEASPAGRTLQLERAIGKLDARADQLRAELRDIEAIADQMRQALDQDGAPLAQSATGA